MNLIRYVTGVVSQPAQRGLPATYTARSSEGAAARSDHQECALTKLTTEFRLRPTQITASMRQCEPGRSAPAASPERFSDRIYPRLKRLARS